MTLLCILQRALFGLRPRYVLAFRSALPLALCAHCGLDLLPVRGTACGGDRATAFATMPSSSI